MLIKRHAEETAAKFAEAFRAVLVTGARQTGKTTLLKGVFGKTRFVTLDEPFSLLMAKEQEGAFIKDNPPPVIIDEIQYAPNLLSHIKIILDNDSRRGQYLMTGSQKFELMRDVSESLAGRIGIMNLPGISLREARGDAFSEPFTPTVSYLSERMSTLGARDDARTDIWETIHRGSMPELVANPGIDWNAFYSSYTKTYVERDVRKLAQAGDETKFMRFMAAAASITGQLLNLASLARDVRISEPTAERWMSILESSNIIHRLQPYHTNATKRALATPKLYFLDTGLAAYLTRWVTPEVLKVGSMSGAFFETFVVSEIIKSYENKGIDPPLHYFREKGGKEIDLLISEGNTMHPVEIKKHSDPDARDTANFSMLDKLPGVIRGSGGVICRYDRLATLKGEDKVIPLEMI
jgi:predicted AAA+ superfamily ATPase